MIKKKLGRTGLEVTPLGYGSMGLRGPNTWGVRVVGEEDADRCLNSVLDAGINFIDTAPDYGVSEERIGRYISSRRSEFYLATKCGCAYVQHEDHLEIRHVWNKDVLQRNIETSLQRLKTDFLDVLQFHGGDADTLQRKGLIELLMGYRDQGIVRFIGVSSSLPQLPGLIDLGVFDTFQIPYSCLAPEHHDWIAKAAGTGAGIIIRGGIAQGGPDAEIQRPALNDCWTRAKLDDVLPPRHEPCRVDPPLHARPPALSHDHRGHVPSRTSGREYRRRNKRAIACPAVRGNPIARCSAGR